MTPTFKVRVHGNEREGKTGTSGCAPPGPVSHHVRVSASLCLHCARVEDTPRRHHSHNLGPLRGFCLLVCSRAGVRSVLRQMPLVLGLICSSADFSFISSADTVTLLVALGGLSRCEQLGLLILWSLLTQPLAKLEGFCLSAAGKVQLLLWGICHCLTRAATQALQSVPIITPLL